SSSSRLWVALATAERSTFSTTRLAFCGEKRRTARASSTLLPRIISVTSRALRGDSRTYRATARASMACSSSLQRGRALRMVAVTPEGPRRGELAQLVAHHVLGDVNGHMLPAVMDGDGVAHHLRGDGRRPGPGLDDPTLPGLVQLLDALHQLGVHIGPLLQ